MSGEDGFRPDLRGLPREAFRTSVDAERFADPSRHEQALRAREVELKAAQLREQVRTHQGRMEERFIEREYARLKRTEPLSPQHSLARGPRPPFRTSNQSISHEQALRMKAEANVKLNFQKRLHRIDVIERRQVRDIMRGQSRDQVRSRTRRR